MKNTNILHLPPVFEGWRAKKRTNRELNSSRKINMVNKLQCQMGPAQLEGLDSEAVLER